MAELHLLSPAGFRATGVHAGIKSTQTPDVGLLVCDHPATAACAFTTNRVVSAAVTVGREHVASGSLRAVVMNSGNANACTGKQGEKDARAMCRIAAQALGCDAREVLPSSTGIIGHLLPMEKVERGIRQAADYLGNDLEHAHLFSSAILTTDTKRKTAAVEVKIARQRVRIAGVCKGAGMIGPRLGVDGVKIKQATMLAYLTTDVLAPAPLLRKLLAASADRSFNAVTIDDHASTNDTAALLASGVSGVKVADDASRKKFADALDEVTQSLAYQIAADGEGATKVVAITVRGGADHRQAIAMARTIANSPLVKCAMNGNDPNWGRIVSAAGYAGVPFDASKTSLKLQNVEVFRNGAPVPFDAAALSEALRAKEVQVLLTTRPGAGVATVWTCDLSKEYVSINADYHT